MTTEIRVPTLGESVSEATVGKWYKQTGEAVTLDEPLVELETDKVTIDVPAPIAGTLAEIIAKTGDSVEVGALLAQLAEGIGDVSPKAIDKDADKIETKAAEAKPEQKVDEVATPSAPAPSAAKLMAENDLAADTIKGSGKRGQILKGDVLEAISAIAATPQPAPTVASPATQSAAPARKETAGEERVRMTKLRQTIAQRLKNAQNTAAMLTTFNEVDMSAVIALRKKYRDLFQKKHDVKLGFMGFFTKAVCHALKEVPAVNAEIDGTDIIYKNFAHIGIAVGTDKGLVVPVVRNADQLSIAEIEKEISRLGKQARDGKLSMADMQGGTFTITNGGIYGSLMSTPILNAPQSGILGMHAIKERPIAVDGEVKIRPMMYLAVSYDHRIVDGQEAVTFLVRIKESLENPERLVLDL